MMRFSFVLQLRFKSLGALKMAHPSDLAHHLRSHCRGMTIVSWRDTMSSGVLQTTEMNLGFSTKQNVAASLDRLYHARFRRIFLDIELLGMQSSVPRKQEQFSLIISLLPENLRPDDLKQHIQTETLGIVGNLLVNRSKTGNKKATCLVETYLPGNVAMKRLRQAAFKGAWLDIEIANAEYHETHLGGFRAKTTVPNREVFAQEEHRKISLAVCLLPEDLRRDDLKNYIEKKTLGFVLDLRIERSKTGRMKAMCTVETQISKAAVLKLLREATFCGTRLDVEIVEPTMAPTQASKSGTQTCQPHFCENGKIALFLSKLPNVGASLLKHHLQSHTSGRVVVMETGPSSRGGMKAFCLIETRVDPKHVLGRLQRARFQGRQLHVQILRSIPPSETFPSSQKVLKNGATTVAAAAPSSDELHPCSVPRFDRSSHLHVVETPEKDVLVQPDITSHDELFSSEAVQEHRNFDEQLAAIVQSGVHSIATRFLRYVTSEPERLSRSENAADLDDLFEKFCMMDASMTRNNTLGDGNSRAWLDEPPMLSISPETPNFIIQTQQKHSVASQTDDAVKKTDTASQTDPPTVSNESQSSFAISEVLILEDLAPEEEDPRARLVKAQASQTPLFVPTQQKRSVGMQTDSIVAKHDAASQADLPVATNEGQISLSSGDLPSLEDLVSEEDDSFISSNLIASSSDLPNLEELVSEENDSLTSSNSIAIQRQKHNVALQIFESNDIVIPEDDVSNKGTPEEEKENIGDGLVVDLSLSKLGISGMSFVDVGKHMVDDSWSVVSDV